MFQFFDQGPREQSLVSVFTLNFAICYEIIPWILLELNLEK